MIGYETSHDIEELYFFSILRWNLNFYYWFTEGIDQDF